MSLRFPLTPVQLGMLYESTLANKPWLNLEQVVCHLDKEPIDPVAMERAWQEITDAHPELRQVILPGDGDAPMQTVQPEATVRQTVEDWRALSPYDANLALEAWLTSDRTLGVDPGVAPGFRETLIHLGPERGALVWTFPHTLLDGRSFTHLLKEVFERYEIARAGGVYQITSPTAPAFADHCLALAKMDHASGAEYFQTLLEGYDGSFGIAKPGVEPDRKIVVEDHLTKQDTTALSAAADAAGVTMGTMVQAAWGVVLARWSARGDAVFGVTLSGRHLLEGSEGSIGCFINTLPARVRLTRGQTFGALLTQLRAEQIALRPFEQTPLVDVKSHSDVPPDRPLFDSLVMFERGSLTGQMQRLGGSWANRRVDLREEGALPVTLAVYHDPELLIRLEYDPTQVPEGERLAGYVKQILQSMATADLNGPLADINMLPEDETARLHGLGHPDPVEEPDHCCATAFETIAARWPDRAAVSQTGEGTLRYRELNDSANQMAHLLRSEGIGPGAIVGLCLSRSPSFIVSMLAVWKAGAAFVPMDPSYPLPALEQMCEDSEAALVITDETAPDLPCRTLPFDPAQIAGQPTTAPDRAGMDPARLAYVIFTSGSTGRPKGVMVSHASLAAHSAAMTSCYELTEQDRALQFASLSFDVSLEEIVPTLLNGAELVLRSATMAESGHAFLDEVAALNLSVINLPTGFWLALTDTLETSGRPLPPSVRLVVVGGERVPAPALRRWRDLVPGVRWMNGYGPTETTITCTVHEVTDDIPDGDSVPIGRPTGHARAMVLAADGSLSPEGAVGELWISGPAVAMGYLNRPDQTAERFVPDPFAGGEGRMYCSGDLVHWENGGVLAYLGRADRQIKLRGYRIEPGEVETALEGLPNVGHALVAVDQEGTDQARLVAWISPDSPDVTLDAEALTKAAAGKLTRQMRPLLIPVTEWPKTPGGKIDVARLPRPGVAVTTPEEVAPCSDEALEIAALYGTVLGLENVSPDASFFDLGGHSLLLLRLLGQIESKFGKRISVAAVHDDPTPRGLAEKLSLDHSDDDALYVVPIQTTGTLPPIYGVHVLGINESYFRPMAAEFGPDQPMYGLTIGLLSADTPVGVEETAEFYRKEIEKNQPEGPLSLFAVSAGSYIALELAQQLLDSGREVLALVLLDAEGPAGRGQIGKVAKIGAHWRRFRNEGMRYVRHVADGKRQNLRNSYEKLKLNLSIRLGLHQAHAQTVDEFVAANQLAIQQYVPQQYPRAMTIIRAQGNVFDSAECIESGLGWQYVATNGLNLIEVPGDHLTILEKPNVAHLADQLRDVLAAARVDYQGKTRPDPTIPDIVDVPPFPARRPAKASAAQDSTAELEVNQPR